MAKLLHSSSAKILISAYLLTRSFSWTSWCRVDSKVFSELLSRTCPINTRKRRVEDYSHFDSSRLATWCPTPSLTYFFTTSSQTGFYPWFSNIFSTAAAAHSWTALLISSAWKWYHSWLSLSSTFEPLGSTIIWGFSERSWKILFRNERKKSFLVLI